MKKEKTRWIGHRIEEILADDREWSKPYLEYSVRTDGTLVIKWGAMYEAPRLSFGKLKALSELFGTDKIDVDDYANSGCESCDFGSNYGHEVTIEEATKEVDAFKKMVEDAKKPKTGKVKGRSVK